MHISSSDFYKEFEVKGILRKLPYLLDVITSPKNSMRSLGTKQYKVYAVHHSTFLLDLVADVSRVWNQIPSFFRNILSLYYLCGLTDYEIGCNIGRPLKTVFRLRSLAVGGLCSVLCDGDWSGIERLEKFKLYPRKSYVVKTRVWRADGAGAKV